MATEPSGTSQRGPGPSETAARERVLQILRYSPDIGQSFGEFAEALRDLVPAERVSIALLESAAYVRVAFVHGEGPGHLALGQLLPRPGSLVDTVATQQVPYLLEHSEDQPRYPDLAAMIGHGYQSVLLMPLMIRGTSIGTINLASFRPALYTQADLARLVPVVQHLSLAIAHFQLADDLQRRNRYLQNLAALAAAMNESRDLESVCSVAVRKVVASVQLPAHAVIYLFDAEQQQLVLTAAAGLSNELAAQISRRSADQGISGRVAHTGKPLVVADVATDPLGQHLNPPMLAAGVRSCASFPLLAQGQVVGVMTVGAFQPRHWPPDEIEHLQTISLQIGTAIQRAQAYDEAWRARRQQQGLVAAAAHELRSPLQSILGFCELLLSGPLAEPPLTEEQQDCIRVIHQRGKQQVRMIESLLDLTRIGSGRLHLRPAAVALPELLAELEQAFRPLLQEKQQTLELVIPAGLPALLADRDLLYRILDNLKGNAVKYTPPGGTITIGAAPEGAGHVRVNVRDTGPGIPAEQRELVFDPFYRFCEGSAPGAGLGLAIARDLVERHGGRIWVEDAPGGGSIFSFTLPIL